MRKQSGLTLVELMIAIGLMLIVTLQLQIVFGQSRKLYTTADAMAQVYSNARAALDQIEKDVSNAVKTDQMEFFAESATSATGPGAGHYNMNEEIPTLRGKFIATQPYLNAMTFRQYDVYTPKDAHKVGGPYRRDSMYFRSFTTVNGQPREVLVEYRLWLGNDPTGNPLPRPILQRIVTGPKIDPSTGLPMYDPNGIPIIERKEPQDVCYYVQEFKVDLYIRDRRRKGIGRFYSPEDATKTSPSATDRTPPGLTNLIAGGSREFAVQCMDGKNEVDATAMLSTTDAKLRIRSSDPGARLPRLGPGDKMYVATRKVNQNFFVDFNAKYLTIKEIAVPTPGETVVTFEEESAMVDYLNGNKTTIGTVAELESAYRSGWLPEAIRVQMKIKDQRSQEIRTITRIFQLLRA